MSKLAPEVKQSLELALEKLSKEHPHLKGIMDSAKSGDLSEQEAMSALMKELGENPQHMPALMAIMKDAFNPTRNTTGIVPTPKTDLKESGDSAFWNDVGLPQMNPLAQAAIAERLQFDGDIPELRTGPAPAGVTPALSVHTNARSPVAIGQMMQQASDRMSEQLEKANTRRADLLEQIAGASKNETSLVLSQMEMLKQMGVDETDLTAIASHGIFDPEG